MEGIQRSDSVWESDEFQQIDHFDGSERCFLALVASLATGAFKGLFERFAGEHPEGHWDATPETGLENSRGGLAVDVFVVSCGPLDDGPEANHGVDLAGFGEAGGDKRKLEGSGHPGNGDPGRIGAMLRERFEMPSSSRRVTRSLKRETTRAKSVSAASS